jgi:hypothetical protein
MRKFFRESGEIKDLSDLREMSEAFLESYRIDSVYLRGQADYCWGLRPTIGRPLKFLGLETDGFKWDRELYLLNRFRRYIRAFLDRDVSDKELLFLARHHGIPVRIIDWTSNPLVALYYACIGDQELSKDGAVWAIRRCQHPHRYFYDFYTGKKPILELKGVKLIYAPYVSPRIPAQSGNFTTQDDPSKDLQCYNPSKYRKQDFDIDRIEKWRVRSSQKKNFILALERFGIHERTLFPDLDGIARGIVRSEVLRTGSPVTKS